MCLERKHFCIFKVTESQCVKHPVSLQGKNLSVGHGVCLSLQLSVAVCLSRCCLLERPLSVLNNRKHCERLKHYKNAVCENSSGARHILHT